MFDCLLLMAGSGTRTTLNYNKIEYKINGKPLYQYSLEKFLSLKECNKVILVVKEDEYNKYKDLANERIDVVIGGDTRFNSVLNGARKATQDIVLIHDAARPNIKVENIIDLYNKKKRKKRVVL